MGSSGTSPVGISEVELPAIASIDYKSTQCATVGEQTDPLGCHRDVSNQNCFSCFDWDELFSGTTGVDVSWTHVDASDEEELNTT